MTFSSFHGTSTYLTDPSLDAAVRCALVLQRPLLVRGEPGTGKTLLAIAIAEALDAQEGTTHNRAIACRKILTFERVHHAA